MNIYLGAEKTILARSQTHTLLMRESRYLDIKLNTLPCLAILMLLVLTNTSCSKSISEVKSEAPSAILGENPALPSLLPDIGLRFSIWPKISPFHDLMGSH